MSTRFDTFNAKLQSDAVPTSPLDSVELDGEEEMVVDDRSSIRPAQAVQNKLSSLLKGDFAVVSQMPTKNLISSRVSSAS